MVLEFRFKLLGQTISINNCLIMTIQVLSPPRLSPKLPPQALMSNSSVQSLHLCRSGIKSSGVAALAEALKVHPNLTEINVTDNVQVRIILMVWILKLYYVM
jgi:hypothetical protein